MAVIVVVEDDKNHQRLYNEFLSSHGYQVISAYEGKEGLEKIREHNPNLLILDMAIPGMSGRDLILAIKKFNKHLPIIIVSGKTGMQSDPEIEMSSQVYRFFSKPINWMELLHSIQSVLNNKKDKPDAPKEGEINQKFFLGKNLGGCILEECIGEGASGFVYKAKRKNTLVAVKVLKSSEYKKDEEEIARFQREARVLASVHHNNIIELLDSGFKDGFYYLVMSYFVGEGVSNILRREKKFSISEATFLVKEIAIGLHAIHEANMIHRDIKPSNVLYHREKKQIKIIDFGLARGMDENYALTRPGETLGTPYYMSPEQCQALPLDRRSDVYSLGAIFFHLLTGTVPFKKDNIMATLMAHLTAPLVWPWEYRTPTYAFLRPVVEKMMAKSPETRYSTMQEVVEDLEKLET